MDIDRKRWEEYEQEEAKASTKSLRLVEPDDESEVRRRAERKDVMAELASDTAKGREEHRLATAKRERDKMTRLALIRSKAAQSSNQAHSSDSSVSLSMVQRPSLTDSDEEAVNSNSPRPKRAKLAEASE